MSVKGAFTITLSGPAEQRDALLDAFACASIAARASVPDRTGAEEEAKSWVEAEFHDGSDSPGSDFQQQCMARVAAVADPLGYEMRSAAMTVAAAADLVHVIDKRTGNVVMQHFGPLPQEALVILAEELRIPAAFLEITEPPGPWDVPEA
ncbi:hypothetical protein ACWDZX_16810 [Streptomyces collinus]